MRQNWDTSVSPEHDCFFFFSNLCATTAIIWSDSIEWKKERKKERKEF